MSASDEGIATFKIVKGAKEVWVNDGGVIDEAYFRKSMPLLNERLALAGLRLAKLLNDSLR